MGNTSETVSFSITGTKGMVVLFAHLLPMVKFGWWPALLFFGISLQARAQNPWDEQEIDDVFGAVELDVSQAVLDLESRGIVPYDFGQYLLRIGNLDEAQEWYQSLWLAGKDPQYYFGLAWIKWSNGDAYGALKDACQIMGMEASLLIQARTLVLIGSINIEQGNLTEANRNLEASFKAFSRLDKAGGQFLSLTALAVLALHQKDYGKVKTLLDKAYQYNEKMNQIGKKPFSMGRYHEIVGAMDFARGNFEKGKAELMESESAYREDGMLALADNILVGLAKASQADALIEWENTGHSPADDKGSSPQKRKKPKTERPTGKPQRPHSPPSGKLLLTVGPGPVEEGES